MQRANEPRTPNWRKWRHVPTAKLWEAVALSLDIEPNQVRHNKHSWMAETHLFDEGEEFADRVFVTRKNLGKDPLLQPTLIQIGHPEACEVLLVDFVRWTQAIGWEIPAALSDIATVRASGQDTNTGRGGKWPWGTHETESLRLLAEAARQFWTTYDPEQPATAPLSADVRGWLMKQGASRRVAEIMAQILRPEELPTGPRTGNGRRPKKAG